MFSKIKHIVANTLDGKTKWRVHVNAVFADFSGNALSERKAEALAAALLKYHNAHEFRAFQSDLLSQGRLQDELCALVRGCYDNDTGTYFDYYRCLSAKSDENQTIELCMVTTVFLNRDDERIEISQRMKVLDSHSDDYREAHLAYERFKGNVLVFERASDKDAVSWSNLDKDVFYAVKSDANEVMAKSATSIEGINDPSRFNMLLGNYIRAVQQQEFERVTKAIGMEPRLACAYADSAFLFHGHIDWPQPKK